MSDIIEIIKKLPNLKVTGGVGDSEILEAEKALNVKFASDYKEYLHEFGQVRARGLELTGISASKLTSVVNNTLREKQLGTIPPGMYLIEDIGIDGLLYAQDSKGGVYELLPHVKPRVYANSLTEYILSTQK